jgi:hypothetical protein
MGATNDTPGHATQCHLGDPLLEVRSVMRASDGGSGGGGGSVGGGGGGGADTVCSAGAYTRSR